MNFQTYGSKGFNLRLRLYSDGETKYVNVNKLLKGDLSKRHWSAKRKCFLSSAPFSEENNNALYEFMGKYEEAIKEHPEMPLSVLISIMQGGDEKLIGTSIMGFIDKLIEEMKKNSVNPDGTISEGYTAYEKTKARLIEYCEHISVKPCKLRLEDITHQFVNNFLLWISSRGTGRCLYVSTTLHAILAKATKEELYDIKKVENCNWMKKTWKSSKKYETLTAEQCKMLVEMPLDQLPSSKKVELYRDFCVFVLYTCQSPCDALSLKNENIQNINGADFLVFKRRKIANKQSIDCIVPINDVMKEIMDKWRRRSKDGYIFPVRNNSTIRDSVTNNGEIKHFISRINTWLGKLSPILGCKFKLHTYVLRHTGITHYISKGVSHVYVANLAGTSVSNIEQIYYNNQCDTFNRDKVLDASY